VLPLFNKRAQAFKTAGALTGACNVSSAIRKGIWPGNVPHNQQEADTKITSRSNLDKVYCAEGRCLGVEP